MRPTHIVIIGKSKFVFNTQVRAELRDGRFKNLIQGYAAGPTILLSDAVQHADDAQPLLTFLARCGIPGSDIRVRYPSDSLEARIHSGLEQGLAESRLRFGADVAERDEGLKRYFISTESFRSVKQHQRHVVVGPKGSGKSAMLKALSSDDLHTLVITPEHYATEVLEVLQKGPMATELAGFTATWKYTLLIEIFRKLVQINAGEPRAIGEMRQYLRERGHLGGDLSLFERFLSYLRRITQIKGKVGPVEAEVGVDPAGELGKLFKMEELLELLPSLQKVLRRTPFTVYIDELDQGWNNTETANQFLLSLLTAAIQLRGISEQLHVVVFLRSEIFDLLKPNLPQLDKLRTDIETVQWSRRELVNLIVSRAVDSLKLEEKEDIDATSAIRELFPGVVEPPGAASFEYLLSRTSFRPREVIQFSNLALEAAKALDSPEVGPAAVLRAEEVFSTWKLEHIVAESMYIHPRLDDLLERFRGKPARLSANGIDGIVTEMLLEVGESERKPGWWREGMEPADVLRLLYGVEVLGVERIGGAQGRQVWEGYDFVYSRPKVRPEEANSYLFHPGLWKALELA